MRHFVILFIHLIVSRPARPAGGLRSVVAESVLVRHQLRILNRSRKRSPNLRTSERVIAGLCAPFMNPAHLLRSAIVLKPSTLPHLHQLLAKRKYRMLFSPQHGRPPGPKGPNRELIQAVVELKRRNPNWGCPRIAQQITLAFGVEIDKDVVRRILCVHYSHFPSHLIYPHPACCRASAAQPRPSARRSFPPLNSHKARVRCKPGRPPSNGFIERDAEPLARRHPSLPTCVR